MNNMMNQLSLFTRPDLENVTEITSAEYFYDSHCHLSTHDQIINDFETIETFREWIRNSSHVIKNKIVMDVGCGTGLLSMMAADAGASKVISVEWSNIVEYTKKIIRNNHLEKKITVIRGRVEDIELPAEIKKVDVIISLWMGYSMFQGGRLKAVLTARDKWLKKGGYIIPDQAVLYVSAITDDHYRENNIDWWKNVYGFDMSCLVEDVLRQAVYCILPPDRICSNKFELVNIDLKTDRYRNVIKEMDFRLTIKRNDYVQGLCTYFTVKFSEDTCRREINTDPLLPAKQWGQTVFYFKNYIVAKKKEKLLGSINFFSMGKDNRFLGLFLSVHFDGEMQNEHFATQYYLKS